MSKLFEENPERAKWLRFVKEFADSDEFGTNRERALRSLNEERDAPKRELYRIVGALYKRDQKGTKRRFLDVTEFLTFEWVHGRTRVNLPAAYRQQHIYDGYRKKAIERMEAGKFAEAFCGIVEDFCGWYSMMAGHRSWTQEIVESTERMASQARKIELQLRASLDTVPRIRQLHVTRGRQLDQLEKHLMTTLADLSRISSFKVSTEPQKRIETTLGKTLMTLFVGVGFDGATKEFTQEDAAAFAAIYGMLANIPLRVNSLRKYGTAVKTSYKVDEMAKV